MCIVYHLGGLKLRVDCEFIDPDWWRHPDPLIDLTRFDLGEDNAATGPRPEPFKVELTKIGDVLFTAGNLRDADHADRLGTVAAEIGNSIAEQAKVDVKLEWTSHQNAG
jgi:hypothetical protein